MLEAKKLSQDNAFVSDLVLRQHVCPSRDNQNDQRQQKRQPTAVDPAEGKLRKITTQKAIFDKLDLDGNGAIVVL